MLKSEGTPTISYSAGLLAELVADRAAETTSFLVQEVDGHISKKADVTLPNGERLVPLSPSNNLIRTGCALFPSDMGEFGDKQELLAEIVSYLRRYVDLSPGFEEVAAHYVLLSWVYDVFNEIGYLRLAGTWGSGKTRALLTLGSICYKPFFASGASTVSPIFHILDSVAGTLVLDEADLRFSDATAELTKILNNGTVRGLPVLRTMTNRNRELNPQAFQVFGPKIIAMRERFDDEALESRFITEHTGQRPLPPHIPLHLPDSLAREAQQLRNKLLAWRFHARSKVRLDPSRSIVGVPPRVNQMALPLLSLVDDPAARERIAAYLVGEAEAERVKRSESDDAVLVRAIRDLFAERPRANVPIAEVVERLRLSPGYERAILTPKAIGWKVRTRLRVSTTKSNGVYVIPQSERPRLEALATNLGVDDARSQTVH
jgi:hypothetical protein